MDKRRIMGVLLVSLEIFSGQDPGAGKEARLAGDPCEGHPSFGQGG